MAALQLPGMRTMGHIGVNEMQDNFLQHKLMGPSIDCHRVDKVSSCWILIGKAPVPLLLNKWRTLCNKATTKTNLDSWRIPFAIDCCISCPFILVDCINCPFSACLYSRPQIFNSRTGETYKYQLQYITGCHCLSSIKISGKDLFSL